MKRTILEFTSIGSYFGALIVVALGLRDSFSGETFQGLLKVVFWAPMLISTGITFGFVSKRITRLDREEIEHAQPDHEGASEAEISPGR